MPIASQRERTAATRSAETVAYVHQHLVEFLRPGLTLPEIDEFVAARIAERGAKSCFLKYKIPRHPPFPSHSCLSVNNCVVHGTHLMDAPPLARGDIVSIDVGVKENGWVGDAGWTYAIAEADPESLRLMEAGRESLRIGIEAMQPGRPLIDWAKAVQKCVEDDFGFHLVRGLGGHGYGRTMHAKPFISNVVPKSAHEWPEAWSSFKPGMLIAVEPMIAAGTPSTHAEPHSWPIFTSDGSRAVHYEADVLITEDGPVNLTKSMFDAPDIVG